MSKKRVVVTGVGLVSCYGTDVDAYYQNLLDGVSGVGPLTAFDCEDYATRYAAQVADFSTESYIEKKLDRRIDPFIRYALVASKKALEMATIKTEEEQKVLDKTRCGVIISSGMGGMTTFQNGVLTLDKSGPKRVNPFFIPFMISNMAGGLLAIDEGFMGPNYSISTACATANYSFVAGASHIQNGDADVMVCGGAEAPLIPVGVAGFIACKALTGSHNDDPQKASRPWDQQRDGFVLGEGSAVLVLESLEHAEKRGAKIICEYMGGAYSCDAYHITSPRPSGEGMALCMENAIRNAGVSKDEINYINAHATSTPAGDLVEISAVHSVFGKQTDGMKINGTKSLIGHGLGASGALEAVATIKAIETGKLHPTINLENPAPELGGLDPIANNAIDFDVDVALSNSFGFGGHNASVLFKAYQA